MSGALAFEVYEDREGAWRWRLVAANGRIVADSGEGYTRASDAHSAVARVKARTGAAAVRVRKGEAAG